MIVHKHITKIAAALMILAVCLCLAATGYSHSLTRAVTVQSREMEYETKLFDTKAPIQVNILMDETEWEKMLKNATSKQYYPCDVQIQGQKFSQVGIRPKGNTSLSSIARDEDTDRYSLKLEFDQYTTGQTCFGLDKLILNSNYGDATNMKEALVYDMYQYLGADASLYNYAEVSVNGQYQGVYLALEAVEESFLMRNYGTDSGKLYKPDSMKIGGGGQNEKQKPNNGGHQDAKGPGGFPGNSGGADLNYTDNEHDSYSTIWEGEVTDSSTTDHMRVITALKNISEGKDPETCMDIDNLLKYMAVHVFSVNQDSLSGNMAHNYYLYESNGRLNLLPWDYNLAFGGMGGMDAGDTVNDAIDTPWEGTHFFDRLLENETYLAQYHNYLQQLTEEYIFGGGFEAFYQDTRSQIDSLVKTDPTAFFTFEEYTEAAQTLYELVRLRGTSVLGQLEGSIPSTDSGQQEDPSSLIDASSTDLSTLGSMEMEGRGQGAPGGRDGQTPDGRSGRTPGDRGGQIPDGRSGQAPGDRGGQTPGVGNENPPDADFGGNESAYAFKNLTACGICFAVLTGGWIFAASYRQKSRKR